MAAWPPCSKHRASCPPRTMRALRGWRRKAVFPYGIWCTSWGWFPSGIWLRPLPRRWAWKSSMLKPFLMLPCWRMPYPSVSSRNPGCCLCIWRMSDCIWPWPIPVMNFPVAPWKPPAAMRCNRWLPCPPISITPSKSSTAPAAPPWGKSSMAWAKVTKARPMWKPSKTWPAKLR